MVCSFLTPPVSSQGARAPIAIIRHTTFDKKNVPVRKQILGVSAGSAKMTPMRAYAIAVEIYKQIVNKEIGVDDKELIKSTKDLLVTISFVCVNALVAMIIRTYI